MSNETATIATTPESVAYSTGLTPVETLFFRLCSALEGVTIYIIVLQILPAIYKKRNRSSFYSRLGITYILILVILIIRFYDFLETNIFQTMNDEGKMRFILYFIGPLECVFDLSLVSLSVEAIIDISATYISERNIWFLYLTIVVCLPIFFLLLMVIVWESAHTFRGVLNTALVEDILPAVATVVLLVLLYLLARRKASCLNQEQTFKAKLMVTLSLCETLGVLLNLGLYLAQAQIVLDDLMDSLMKVGVCCCYLVVRPGSLLEPHVLSSLHDKDRTTTNQNILREEHEVQGPLGPQDFR